MRSFTLLCFLICLIAPQQSRAQAECGAYDSNEIAIELDNPSVKASVTLYDNYGDAMTTSDGRSTLNVTTRPGECDLFISFPTHGNQTNPAVVVYDNQPHPLTVKIQTASTTKYVLYSSPTPGCPNGPDSFFCPSISSSSGGENDFFILVQSTGIRIAPTYMQAGDYVDEAIPGEDWILPYHANKVCSDPAVSCAGGALDRTWLFVMPTDGVYEEGVTFTKRISETITLPAAGVYDWTEDWLTLEFDSGTKLNIESTDFNATDMTFTASGAGGWGGIRFAPGSSGGLDNVQIRSVGGSGYALDIDGSSPIINNVEILSPASGTASGIRVLSAPGKNGPTRPTISNTEVSGMHGDGIVLAKPSHATLLSNTVTGSGGGTRDGLLAGALSEATLARAAGFTEGNQFSGNRNGIYALLGTSLTFARNGSDDGFNSANNNLTDGLYARGGSSIDAGNNVFAQRNRFLNNGGDDVRTENSGTAVYALCNWWGTPAPPFDTSVTGGSLLFNSDYLEADPYLDPNALCTSQQTAKNGTDPQDALFDARAAVALNVAHGVDALNRVVDEYPEYAAVALMDLARIAARDPQHDETNQSGIDAAMAHLDARTSMHGDDARRALLHAVYARGDLSRALDLAETLATSEAEEDRRLGHVMMAYIDADMGRDPVAALLALEQTFPGSMESALAWESITGERPQADEGRETLQAGKNAQAAGPAGLASVRPNPTTGAGTAPLTLTEAARVQAVVYDALGREIATVHEGEMERGIHALQLQTDGWAPGLYLLRVNVEGETTTRHLQRFTVAR